MKYSITLLVILSWVLTGCQPDIKISGDHSNTSSGDGIPIISSQLVNQTVSAGDDVSFTAIVHSSTPATYQWQKDSIDISGENRSTLTIFNVQVSDIGMYRIIVSNSHGVVESEAASLTLLDGPPRIVIQPKAVNTIENSDVTFDVQAESLTPITYQWRKDGVDLISENSKSLSLSMVSQATQGEYSVSLTNNRGTVDSNVAELIVSLAPAPEISSQPISVSTSIGSNVNFSVVASGIGILKYQWSKDGVELPDSNVPTLPIESVSVDDEGSYQVTITDDSSATTSMVATLRLLDPATVLIENYQSVGSPIQLLDSVGTPVGNNLSGITWHQNIGQYLVVRNNYRRIYRYDPSFLYLGEIDVGGDMQGDTEGIAYVSGNQVLVSTEQEDFIHKVIVDFDTTWINSNYDTNIGAPAYLLSGELTGNKGLEGVAYSPEKDMVPGRVYAVKERDPMKVYRFDLPEDPDPMALFSYNTNLIVEEPFIAEAQFKSVVTDLAGMVFDKITGHLFILSEESHKVIQVDPDTGAIVSTLNLSGSPQYEGITIGSDGEIWLSVNHTGFRYTSYHSSKLFHLRIYPLNLQSLLLIVGFFYVCRCRHGIKFDKKLPLNAY